MRVPDPTSRKFALALIAATFFVVWLAELVLLLIKYKTFSGGFLQAYPLLTWPERVNFVLATLALDVALIGLATALWVQVSSVFKARPAVAQYNYVWLIGGGLLTLIAIKYQLVSYFSGAMTFTIAKTLGGGSITDAALYVLDEASIAIYALIIAAAAYYWGLSLVKRWTASGSLPAEGAWPSAFAVVLLAGFSFLLGTSVVLASNRNAALQAGLSNQTAYQMANSFLKFVTDFDGDGYGALGFPHDPSPFDGKLHPEALDVPNNGIDEDGWFGDFKWAANTPIHDPFAAQSDWKAKKHLVLIVLESARADALGKVINGREVTPTLNEMAQNGTSSPAAYSHVVSTVNSLKSLFTGRMLHDARLETSLFTFLKDHGVQVGILSGQNESFGDIASYTKMREAATVFFDASKTTDRATFRNLPGNMRIREDRLLKEVSNYIFESKWTTRQFLYINFQSAHFPYNYPGMPNLLGVDLLERSELTPENSTDVQETYYNSIANADRAISEVLQMLEQKGVRDDTIVVVTSDHGEELFENGLLGHGLGVDPIQSQVPFVIDLPGVEISKPIVHADVPDILLTLMRGEKKVALPQFGGSRRIFIYTGEIYGPDQMGLVDETGKRTTFDRNRRAVRLDQQSWLSLDRALEDGSTRQRVHALFTEWARVRWIGELQERAGRVHEPTH